ncbi:MAG TPA: threonine synthase [Holophagaceae bacterium]|jgi:threonine synthase|nr:threonine synthase [Holophagaceae bacterium]
MSFTSTRDGAPRIPFEEAVLRNLPGDGGLYMPADLTPLRDADALLDLTWHARNGRLLQRLSGAWDAGAWEAVSRASLDFPVPLVEVDARISALELFHGPTLAFKDVGIRVLAAVLARISPAPRLVLTATSGDTGAAVAHAFWNRPGFRVAVLYPKGRVTLSQERQIAGLGANVHAFAMEGSFDACQTLVKGCFADAALSEAVGLVSANSINVSRLLAQVLYYAEAAVQLRKHGKDGAVYSVPSGNFGNLCAGLMARRLGLPIAGLVAATNVNRTVPDHLDGGPYAPRPSVPTMSNAMDIGDPSNWERIAWMHGGDPQVLRRALRWDALSDGATLDALRELRASGYTADPHGAVAYGALRRQLRPGERGVFLATAHPAKFRETLSQRLGWSIPLPEPLRALEARELSLTPLADDLAALKTRLRSLPSTDLP